MRQSNALAIIPARGGSKRIPRKNIRPFLGRPVIAYAIEAALQSGCFEEVMVSTEDREIAEVAMRFGASVPFLRSATSAGDTASTVDVIREVLAAYEAQGETFGVGCCLYATAALVTADLLRRGMDTLAKAPQAPAVVPVVSFRHPIERAMLIREDRLHLNDPDAATKRTQDLEPSWHDAGMFYCFRVESFLEQGLSLALPNVPIRLTEMEAHDIDTEEDWDLAEWKYQRRASRLRGQ